MTPVWPPVAHVLPASGPAGAMQWVPAGAIVLGGLLLLTRVGRMRGLGWAGLVLGIAGGIAVEAAAASSPPAQALSLAQPAPAARLTSPLLITVCGRLAGGSPVHVPAGGDVLSVSVDGRQVLTTTRPSGAVLAPAGPHTLRAEILTSGHREFQPPLVAQIEVTVGGAGPLPAAAACPR